MPVSPEISRTFIEEELELMEGLASSYGWKVDPDLENLRVTVEMRAMDDELFIVEATCDDYKEVPALFEFIEPETRVKGTPKAYPKTGNDSFFHSSGPCICAPFNRKAYAKYFNNAPHGDWAVGDWMTSTANGYDWSNHTKLGDMFGLIQFRLLRAEHYKGRMG